MGITDTLPLTSFERSVYEEHEKGLSISQICAKTGYGWEPVHDVITDVWLMDKQRFSTAPSSVIAAAYRSPYAKA